MPSERPFPMSGEKGGCRIEWIQTEKAPVVDPGESFELTVLWL